MHKQDMPLLSAVTICWNGSHTESCMYCTLRQTEAAAQAPILKISSKTCLKTHFDRVYIYSFLFTFPKIFALADIKICLYPDTATYNSQFPKLLWAAFQVSTWKLD